MMFRHCFAKRMCPPLAGSEGKKSPPPPTIALEQQGADAETMYISFVAPKNM